MTSCASSKRPRPLEDIAPHQQAGAGDRDHLALRQCETEITAVIRRRGGTRGGPSHRPRNIPACCTVPFGYNSRAPTMPTPAHDAASSIASSQSACSISISSLRNSRYSPSDASAAALLKRDQLNGGGNVDDLVGVLADECLPRRVRLRNVVDAHDLEILVSGLRAQRGQAGLDIAFRRAGRDDDGHFAARPRPLARHSPRPPGFRQRARRRPRRRSRAGPSRPATRRRCRRGSSPCRRRSG